MTLIFVSACTAAGGDNADGQFNIKRATQVFDAGFSYIQDIYIDDPHIAKLTLTGLNGLRRIDPAIAVTRKGENDNVTLVFAGKIIREEKASFGDDAPAWAQLATRFITAGRAVSEKLHAATAEQIYAAVFENMANQLDAYSRYSSAEAAREERAKRDGFGGIGVTLEAHVDGALIEEVKTGEPGERAGLQAGDRILSIANEPIAGLSLRRIVSRLRGRIGEAVNLVIRRDAQAEPFTVTVTRARIVEQTVFSRRDGNFAHLQITGFNQDTARELREATEDARQRMGVELRGLILDVRGNPGGLLDQAVAIADLFVRSGAILRTRGRHPRSLQFFNASNNDITAGLPIAVLLDGASASAAEIVASALQDQGRAIIVGASSFGKGTVQQVLRLPNDGELILTWARMHAPSGYVLHRLGVLPTICTSRVANDTTDVAERLISRGDAIRNDFKMRRGAEHLPKDERDAVEKSCPWQPHEEGDLDLNVAEQVLGNTTLYNKIVAFARPEAGS